MRSRSQMWTHPAHAASEARLWSGHRITWTSSWSLRVSKIPLGIFPRVPTEAPEIPFLLHSGTKDHGLLHGPCCLHGGTTDTWVEWLSVVGAVLGSAGSVGATPVSAHYHTPVAPSPVLTTENVSGRGHGYCLCRRVWPGDVGRRYRGTTSTPFRCLGWAPISRAFLCYNHRKSHSAQGLLTAGEF